MADVIAFPAPDRPCPRLHIWRAGHGWELHHESSHGDSWALLDRLLSGPKEAVVVLAFCYRLAAVASCVSGKAVRKRPTSSMLSK